MEWIQIWVWFVGVPEMHLEPRRLGYYDAILRVNC